MSTHYKGVGRWMRWQVPYTDTCVKTTTFYGFIQLLRSRWSRCLSDLKSLEMGLMWTDILQQNRKDKRNDTIYRIKVLDTGALESWISPKTCVTCKIFVVKSNLTCFLEWERNSIFPRQNVEIDLLLSGWSALLWSGISNSPFLTVIIILHILSFFLQLWILHFTD